jgi:hypothetical protein
MHTQLLVRFMCPFHSRNQSPLSAQPRKYNLVSVDLLSGTISVGPIYPYIYFFFLLFGFFVYEFNFKFKILNVFF